MFHDLASLFNFFIESNETSTGAIHPVKFYITPHSKAIIAEPCAVKDFAKGFYKVKTCIVRVKLEMSQCGGWKEGPEIQFFYWNMNLMKRTAKMTRVILVF
jgi:hypothetical protein